MMARVEAERMSFLDGVIAGVFTVPGDGMVDFPAVLAELPGYDRWLVVEAEQDPKRANPLTCKVSHAKASVPTQTVRMVNATPLSAPTQIAEIAVTVVAATVSAVARANAIAIWTARPEVRTRKAPATHRVTMAVHPATCARWNLPRLRMRLTPRRVPTAMLL